MRHLLVMTIAVCVLAVSCNKKENVLGSKQAATYFDIDSFEQQIIRALDGNAVGYAYSISKDGNQVRKGAGGYAVATWDSKNGPATLHSPDKRQDIASCSKTITALTLSSILQEKRFGTGIPLKSLLPGIWNITNESFAEIRLENLYRHESGIKTGVIGYYSLRALAEDKNQTYTRYNYEYQNANYAFMRIAIAYLTHKEELELIEKEYDRSPALTELSLEYWISEYYIQEVNKRVFAPCGIPYTKPTPEGENNPTMNYNVNTTAEGWNKGDMTKYVGSAGWRLSATEQNAIMVYLKHTEKILNKQWKEKMDVQLLGWSLTASVPVTGGMSYMHGGFYQDKNGPNQSDSLGRGCFAVQAIFPNNVECVLQVNSLGGTNNMESTVVPCYEGAWINK